jgi:hypothetical protein
MSHPGSLPQLHAMPHVISVDHGERTVLLDAERERYFSLNATGRIVWELLCDGTTREEIIHRLVERFGGDRESTTHDVAQLLERLTHNHLVSER